LNPECKKGVGGKGASMNWEKWAKKNRRKRGEDGRLKTLGLKKY